MKDPGKPAPKNNNNKKWAIALGILAVFSVIGQITAPNTSQPKTKTEAAIAPTVTEEPQPQPTARTAPAGIMTTVAGYAATPTKEDLDEVTRYSVEKDEAAVEQMAAEGRLIELKGGVEVHVEGCGDIICSTVKFRLPGSTTTMWAATEALE